MKKQMDITVEVKKLTEEQVKSLLQSQLKSGDLTENSENIMEEKQCCQES